MSDTTTAHDATTNAGYVRGLRNAARWINQFDQPLPDFDRATCQNLARGLSAMADSAAERLGVDEESTPTAQSTGPTERIDLMDLVADLAEKGACDYDHHGYCQEHGWLKTDPACPHGRAQKLLAVRSGAS